MIDQCVIAHESAIVDSFLLPRIYLIKCDVGMLPMVPIGLTSLTLHVSKKGLTFASSVDFVANTVKLINGISRCT